MRRWLQPILARIENFRDADRAIKSLSRRISEITGVQLLDGVLVKDHKTNSTGGSTATHILGRVPNGAIVIRSDTDTGYKLTSFTSESFLVEARNGSPTITMWVF